MPSRETKPNKGLSKELKQEPSTKWQKPESILENKKRKIISGFEIQKDHLILARQPDLVIIDKKTTFRVVDFAVKI